MAAFGCVFVTAMRVVAGAGVACAFLILF